MLGESVIILNQAIFTYLDLYKCDLLYKKKTKEHRIKLPVYILSKLIRPNKH